MQIRTEVRTEIPVEVLRLTGRAFDDPHTKIPRGGGSKINWGFSKYFGKCWVADLSTPIRYFPRSDGSKIKYPSTIFI